MEKIINAKKVLFRCSKLSEIMTDTGITETQLAIIADYSSRTKPLTPKQKEELDRLIKKRDFPELSTTCQNLLRRVFRQITWNRYTMFSNKYIEKGIRQEEEAITLISRIKKVKYKKNDIRINNEFITGEPDLYIGPNGILQADEGIDAKCSWEPETFPFVDDSLDKKYWWQGQGYCALTGAKAWTIAYCLVNTPANLIQLEKERVFYLMQCPEDEQHPRYKKYIEKCIEIEKNMIFDMEEFKEENPNFDIDTPNWEFDIPMAERLVEFRVERNEEAINKIYKRVEECRVEMDSKYFKIAS